MQFFSLSTAIGALVAATAADGKIVTIKSTTDTPFFDPVNATANVGDVLEFHFAAHNRSIVQGTFAFPCQPIDRGGFYSGFFTVDDTTTENGTVFRVTVNNTDPIVYYCSQNGAEYGNHCKKGMSGVVNDANPADLEEYQAAAAQTSFSITPDSAPFGGVFAVNPDEAAVSNVTTTSAPTSLTSGVGTKRQSMEWVGGGLVALLMGFHILLTV